jgi:hypothetical protein
MRSALPRVKPSAERYATIAEVRHLGMTRSTGWTLDTERSLVGMEGSPTTHVGLDFTFAGAWINRKMHCVLKAIGLSAAFDVAVGHWGCSYERVAGANADRFFPA